MMSVSMPHRYNWMLSSLALLISNVFLYQSKNSIDSSATVIFSIALFLCLVVSCFAFS